jgi:hypothetical protein
MCVSLTRFRTHRWEVAILLSKTRLWTIHSEMIRVSKYRYRRCPPGEEYRPPSRKPTVRNGTSTSTADPAGDSLKVREPGGHLNPAGETKIRVTFECCKQELHVCLFVVLKALSVFNEAAFGRPEDVGIFIFRDPINLFISSKNFIWFFRK